MYKWEQLDLDEGSPHPIHTNGVDLRGQLWSLVDGQYQLIEGTPILTTNDCHVVSITEDGRLYDLYRRRLVPHEGQPNRIVQVIDRGRDYITAFITLDDQGIVTIYHNSGNQEQLATGIKMIVPCSNGKFFSLTDEGKWIYHHNSSLEREVKGRDLPRYEDIVRVHPNTIITTRGVFAIWGNAIYKKAG